MREFRTPASSRRRRERVLGNQQPTLSMRDFYVDDGLTSVPTTKKAVDLITNTMALCAKEKHWSSTIRVEQHGRRCKLFRLTSEHTCVRDIEVIGNFTTIERVLGIQWSLEDDCFRFRITLKDRPATRRGILSAVSTVYEPLGFLSPVAARKSYRTYVETKRIGMLRSLKTWFSLAQVVQWFIGIRRFEDSQMVQARGLWCP